MLNALLVNYRKYGGHLNTIDLAKFFAIILMVVDHFGFYFFPENLWFRAIGRICVPIWLFFTGYSKPGSQNFQIAILAAILVLFRGWNLFPVFPVNILFTILICRIYSTSIAKFCSLENGSVLNLFVIFVALLVWYLPTGYLFEYGTLAFMFTICGFLQKKKPHHYNTIVSFVVTTLLFIFIEIQRFAFSNQQIIVMSIGVMLVMWLLCNMKLKAVTYAKEMPIIFRNSIRFVARNSLYFYFLHIVIFVILSKILLPNKYIVFRWF